MSIDNELNIWIIEPIDTGNEVMKKEISQEYLKEILDYNPDTGVFIWKKIKYRNDHLIGKEAGTIAAFGYRKIVIGKQEYLSHRLAFLFMDGFMPDVPIDHINHIKDDNRWCNLRLAPGDINRKNLPLDRRNTTGFTGISFRVKSNRYIARINVKSECVYLGCFVNINDAIAVRKSANIKYGFHENHGMYGLQINV